MKIALVTGASRGIGQAIALELARGGFVVFGAATKLSNMNATIEKAHAEGLKIAPIEINVAHLDSIEAAVKAVEEQSGGTIAVLVNNAGLTRDNLLLRMSDDEWSAVIDTNLASVFRLSRRVLRGMVKARFGRIISITSVVGESGNAGQANYAASKAGIAGFSRALAQEIAGRNITVNCIAPGFIATDMTDALSAEQKAELTKKIPAGRLGEPTDIAKAVAFLASDGAGYITGETINVNGGMYMA